MSDKTANQIKVNGELTNWLNEDLPIQQFNVISIQLLQQKLEAIEWDDRFAQWRDSKNGNQLFWFFIKGGTALRILFQSKNQTDVMPDPSDWDTQIVINPELPFDLWYLAYQKIEVAVNEALFLANMCFTLLPSTKNSLKEHPDKGTIKKYFSVAEFTNKEFEYRYKNAEDGKGPIFKLNQEWGGELAYRPAGDRKTAYLCNMFHPLQAGDIARQRFADLAGHDWKGKPYTLELRNDAKGVSLDCAIAAKNEYLGKSKKSVVIVGVIGKLELKETRRLYVVVIDDKGKDTVLTEIQLIDNKNETKILRDIKRYESFRKIEPLIIGDDFKTINDELKKKPEERNDKAAKNISNIIRLALIAAHVNQDMIFDSMFLQETIDVNQREYKDIKHWTEAKKILCKGLTNVDDSTNVIKEVEKHYKFIEQSLKIPKINDGNKNKAIQWLNDNKNDLGLNAAVQDSASKDDVVDLLKKLLPINADAPLASGQKTLIIDEFYLHRLEVRYKYKKPAIFGSKNPADYIDAWTASGNLRGELIDVTVPRRDTFECRHHYKLLKSKQKNAWEVIDRKSGVTGVDEIELPILNEGYHLEEQILITREILSGKSSSPKKIHKRILRGYSLGIDNAGVKDRKNSRLKVIEISAAQFEDTYPNHKTIIEKIKVDLNNWAEGNYQESNKASTKTLAIYFKTQVSKNENLIKCDLNENDNKVVDSEKDKLVRLRTFMADVSDDTKYPDIWVKMLNEKEKKNADDDAYGKKLNAGMLDFFYITAIFAQVASEIIESLKGNKVDLIRSDTTKYDLREMLKYLIGIYHGNNDVFIQIRGSAASYHHLKEQNNSYGNAADSELIVPEVEVVCLYDEKSIEESQISNQHEASINALPKGFTEKNVDKDFYTQLIASIQYEKISLKNKEEQRTEYAYGMPVLNLNTHIKALESSIQAAEFSKSELLKEELDLLHRALTTREYGERYQGMPRIKRRLSVRHPMNVSGVNKV